ncbi:MAG TPA: glycine dehydrogenase, partial [Hyphomicrobiales bacterium]|nr:glycine dehydrogenase [Hyphomicrobiales bacterium]
MRYLPLSDADREAMLRRIGVGAIDDLFADVPEDKRLNEPLDLPGHMSEPAVERALAVLAAKNLPAGAAPFFIGGGAYRHHVPATVDHLIQRSEFLTSYTPYQPEISQGTLQALFEFQTQVALLTGMEVANASMYDGSTGCGEAALMAERVTRRGKAVLSGSLHPHYRSVVANVCRFADHEVVALPADPLGEEDIAGTIDEDTACIVVQTPGVYGNLIDLAPLAEAAHDKGALLVAI